MRGSHQSRSDKVHAVLTDNGPHFTTSGDKCSAADDLRAALAAGCDSLSRTTLALNVEKHFAVRLPPDRVCELLDVGEFADLIAKVRGED